MAHAPGPKLRVPALLVGAVAALGLTVPATAASAATTTAASSSASAATARPHSPWVGPREDETPDGDADAANALCRSLADGKVSISYRRPHAGEVDAIVGDRVNNSGQSNLGCRTPQNETTIAVNPRNSRNLVAGANDYRVCCDTVGLNDGTGWAYYSFDRGRTWRNVQLPGLTQQTGGTGQFATVDSAGDPVVAFGRDGTVYYANIVFNRSSPASGVAVSRSRNGGRSWSAPTMVQYDNTVSVFNDKEWVGVSPKGQVTVTWTRFLYDAGGEHYQGSPIVAKTSTNAGASFGGLFAVSDDAHPYNQGSQVEYDRSGRLYVAYEAASAATSYTTDALALAQRAPGRSTFTTRELARVYDDLDCYPMFADRQTLTNEHFRLNSYPAMDVDDVTGLVAIAWADDQGAGTCGTGGTTFAGTTSNQVKLVVGARSHFSPAVRVTRGAADKVFPGVAVYRGRIAVTYYTRGYASTNPACYLKTPDAGGPGDLVEQTTSSVCLDYAARVSTDGFRSEQRLTSEGSNPYIQFADGSFIGDYTQAAVGRDGQVQAAWTDFRGRPGVTPPNQDVYVNSVRWHR
jgi:hypothetical protein